MSELKPCPFCERENPQPRISYDAMRCWMECPRCGARGPHISGSFGDVPIREEKIAAAWNSRPSGHHLDGEPPPALERPEERKR